MPILNICSSYMSNFIEAEIYSAAEVLSDFLERPYTMRVINCFRLVFERDLGWEHTTATFPPSRTVGLLSLLTSPICSACSHVLYRILTRKQVHIDKGVLSRLFSEDTHRTH